MTARKRKLAVGVFSESAAAQAAVRDLIEAGFREDQIGVLARDEATKPSKRRKKETGTKWEEGAATGVAAGAGVGALWALGIAAGMLPALGPVIAGGLLASVLASAAGGAAVAGLVGALVGLGIPEEEAQYYEEEFKAGRTIVTVQADGRYDEAMDILHRHGAYCREDVGKSASEKAGTSRRRTKAGTEEKAGTVQLHEEQVRATKKPVKKGEVRVGKEVVTEQQTLSVPVEHEEVVIEHRPVRRRKASAKEIDATSSEEIRVPVTREEVEVDKGVVVTEEIEVGKRKVSDTETVSTPVRREELKVEQEGHTRVRKRKSDR